MYKNILVPTDGSPLSRASVEKAVKLAEITGAKITATPVLYKGLLPVGLRTTTEQRALAERAAARYLGYVESLAKKAGVSVKSVHVTDEYPASAILKIAKKEKCDLIYIASHGRTGFRNSMLGSQTGKVLADSPIPVLVHR